ncbi:MAG: thioesterase [Flavobacteriaceae bacterium]|nr:thioesterase [Flavobacteriaceae bacterium]
MDILQKWFPFNYNDIRESKQPKQFLKSQEEQTTVFCFPSAGSSASLYRPWYQATKQNPAVNFVPVEIPGRGNHITAPNAKSIDELIERFLAVFLEVPHNSYILYGHSFGAVVAFQLAYTIQQKGLPLPEKLIVAGRHAPHMKDPSPLNSVSSDEEMIAEIKAMGGTPDVVLNHPEMLKFMLTQLRADLRTHESFKYTGQKLQIPIEAHCGTQDDANKTVVEYWKDVAESEFLLKEFQGHHFFIQSLGESYLNTLLNSINTAKKSFF